MVAKRKKSRKGSTVGTFKGHKPDSVADALHLRFLNAALATKVRRVKEMAAEGGRPTVGQTSARDTDFEVFFAVLLRQLACISLEATIESYIQHVRDNWNTMTAEERDEWEKIILEALEHYQNACG